MSRRVRFSAFVVVAVLGIVSAGCTRSSRSPKVVLSTQELADGLLVADDLEGTWNLNPGPEGADLSKTGIIDDTNRDKLPQFQVCEAASQASREAVNSIEWQAFRQIDKKVDNEIKPPKDREGHMIFVQEWLASGESDELELVFNDISAAFKECLGEIPAGEEGPGTVTEVDIEPIGDQRVAALTQFAEAGGVGTWNIYSVFIRAGTVLMGATAVDIVMGDLEPELKLADLDEILSTALSKF